MATYDPRKPRSPSFSLSGRFPEPATAGALTPGPGTHSGAALGSVSRQPLSNRRNQPSVSFGGGKTRTAPTRQAQVPGPGAYAAPSAIGRQCVSQRRSGPSASLSFRTKLPDSAGKYGAAPGSYNLESGTGQQRLSMRRTQPATGMSRAVRFAPHTRAGRSSGTPGPGQYRTPSSLGPQALSQRRHGGAFSLGAKRKGGMTIPSYSASGPAGSAGDTAFGRQTTSFRPSAARHTFGDRTADSMASRPVVEIYRRLGTPVRPRTRR